jgi:gamma-glutamyltranspeptidase/glutathione hydrolase
MALLLLGLTLAVFLAMPLPTWPQGRSAGEPAVEARHGLVVSVSSYASDVGLAVLKKGGNAVDAAVATALALAVTYPPAGNVGGGGFMVVHPGAGKEPAVIDYRETAPAAATRTMYARGTSGYGHRVVGVPGTVAGLALAHQQFGKLPWPELVKPAVALAEEGFLLDDALAASLNAVFASAADFPEFQRVFAAPAGTSRWRAGDRLVQKDLAATLRQIGTGGPAAFYRGPVAKQIIAEMQAGGGLITCDDLAHYQAIIRQPIHGTYRGFDIYAPPPPSSGGICLVEMLNILENFDLRSKGHAETLHLMVEAMRRAYCDRARSLGDPAFTSIPPHLTSKEYARQLARGINPAHATRSEDLAPDIALAPEGDSTTHFSVIDATGMAVANTYTLERSYGSRVVVRGAGFLLNDEMIDFNGRPGVTTRKGTIGTEPNVIAPGKRMLSSQTPTIVARGGRVLLVTGSPGSRTIINTVLGVLVNMLDFGMDVRAAVDAPRLHHQWFPDVVRFEGRDRFPETVARLRQMGHMVEGTRQGDAHSIWVNPKTGVYHGAADRRISGKAAGY